MTPRENMLRAARFETPETIPVSFHVNAACWNAYPSDALQDLMEAHPLLFPGFRRRPDPFRPQLSPWHRAGVPYRDSWGCLWKTLQDGVTGAVVGHPLARWENLTDYCPPDPARHDGWGEMDWAKVERGLRDAKAAGRLVRGGLRHGHTFLTLTYIRGYENLICDMAEDDPRLRRLIGMVEEFNAWRVRRYVELGVEWMGYPEDLGMQVGPMLSPAHFRQYVKPVYQRLIAPAKQSGAVIHMHSDGDARALVPDLLDAGLDVLNLQDLVNGIDWIRANLKDRVCVHLDIDRQSVTRFGSPRQIEEHVDSAVKALGDRRGGLMLTHGLYPGVPLENARALMDAMERNATRFS